MQALDKMKEAGITPEALAAMLSVTPIYVRKVLRDGRSRKAKTIRQNIANLLGVPIEKLEWTGRERKSRNLAVCVQYDEPDAHLCLNCTLDWCDEVSPECNFAKERWSKENEDKRYYRMHREKKCAKQKERDRGKCNAV